MYPFVRWAQGLELTCDRLELTFGWLGLTFEMTWSLFLEGKQSDGGGGLLEFHNPAAHVNCGRRGHIKPPPNLDQCITCETLRSYLS